MHAIKGFLSESPQSFLLLSFLFSPLPFLFSPLPFLLSPFSGDSPLRGDALGITSRTRADGRSIDKDAVLAFVRPEAVVLIKLDRKLQEHEQRTDTGNVEQRFWKVREYQPQKVEAQHNGREGFLASSHDCSRCRHPPEPNKGHTLIYFTTHNIGRKSVASPLVGFYRNMGAITGRRRASKQDMGAIPINETHFGTIRSPALNSHSCTPGSTSSLLANSGAFLAMK
jgi:hypothetical protein